MTTQRRVLLLILMIVGGSSLAVASASAAARPFEPRFATNDTGNIAMAANTLLTCAPSAAQCAAAQAGTATPASGNNNNAYPMQYVNADPAAPPSVFNSSSAELDLPAGATVLKAMLYYGGDSNAGVGGAAPPSAAARDTAVLKTPGAAGYQPVTALQVDDTTTDGNDFQGVVDVTSEVAAAGPGTYGVGNVQAGTGQDRQAGWSLIVAYRDTADPPRNLSIFDGFQVVNSANPNVSIPVAGFRTPPSGPVRTQLGFVAYEGDAGSTGDGAKLNTTTLSDSSHPARNFFNSAISRDGSAVTTKTPDYVNQLGYDAILTRADGVLANDDTSAVIRLTTGGETYFPGAVTFATDLIAPDVQLQKSVQDVNGGQVEPGDTLRYTVTATNSGPDDATNVVVSDPVPTNATYAPGTLTVDGAAQNDGFPGSDRAGFDAPNDQAVFWLGTGAAGGTGGTLAGNGGTATATFDVVVDTVPSGTELVNTAAATFVARTLGAPLTADSNAVTSTVAAPDLTIAKTPTTFTAVGGGTQAFALTVTNSGDAASSGFVTVVDRFAAGGAFDSVQSASGAGWTCNPAILPAAVPVNLECTRTVPDALAPGASYPPINIVTQVVGAPAAGEIVNTAAVTGGGDGDSTNNSSTAVGQATTRADLQILKTADRSTALVGDQVTFTLRVRNGGPSTATGVVVDDTDLSPDYTVDAVTSSQGDCTALPCDLGTLANGDVQTVTITATVATQTPGPITNVASVTSATEDPDLSNVAPGDPPNVNNSNPVVVQVAPTADLRIAKAASPDPLDSTLPASYTLTVHNDGPQDAANVVVTDPLPAGFVFGSVTGCTAPTAPDPVTRTLICNVGTVADGADATVTINGTLTPATAGTYVTNSAIVGSTTGDPDTTNNTATDSTIAIPAADLDLAKTVDTIAPAAGGTATFTLQLTNHGPSTTSDARVVDTLPAGVQLVSAPPECAAVGSTLTCSPTSLAAGETQSFAIVVRIDGSLVGTSLTNTATASSSSTPDPIEANNADATTIDVAAADPPVVPPVTPPDTPPAAPPILLPPTFTPPTFAPPQRRATRARVSVRKTADRRSVRAGSVIRYRITVRTTGKVTARNLRVCDRPPSGLALISASGPRTLSNGQACWTIRALASGKARTFRLTARAVSTSRTRTIVNRATVRGANVSSRRASAPVRVRPGTLRPSGVTG